MQATPDLCPKYDEKARGRGEYLQKNWVWMCGTFPETLTLVQTKICNFSLPYFRPYQKFDTFSDLKPSSLARDRSA